MTDIQSAAPVGRVARRRAQARQRILAVAEQLMIRRGVDAVTIDAIADAADIARRSFYHHFETKYDVLVPIARARTKSVNQRIDRLVAPLDDPAVVMATAMRHGLRALASDPLCSWFVLKSGLPQQRLFEGLGESGMRDAQRGIDAGRFHIANPEVVRRLMAGAFIAVLSARVEGQLNDSDLDDAVEHLLRLLGLSNAAAHDIAHRPLRPLPAAPPQGDGSPAHRRRLRSPAGRC
jgi:AcrR family transcriptional regulator